MAAGTMAAGTQALDAPPAGKTARGLVVEQEFDPMPMISKMGVSVDLSVEGFDTAQIGPEL